MTFSSFRMNKYFFADPAHRQKIFLYSAGCMLLSARHIQFFLIDLSKKHAISVNFQVVEKSLKKAWKPLNSLHKIYNDFARIL